MPRYNIWIRKDNVEKWNAIKDKSAWVNANLVFKGFSIPYGEPGSSRTSIDTLMPTPQTCSHPNVNKRTWMCPDCSEYTK